MEIKRRLADYKVRPYTKNFDYFDNYLSNHRKHQVDALLEACGSNKGQIISPCGTGKTRIQVSLHIEEMIRLNQDYEYGIFVIASHRLSLNRQLLDQVVDVAVHCGLPFDVLYVGSYKCDLNKYYTKYHHLGYSPKVSRHLASTNHKEIEIFIQQARDTFRNVIVASTYDSFSALKNVGKINITTLGFLGTKADVRETVPSALYLFIKFDNYREAILAAINAGGDTDTTAAIVGNLFGARDGIKNIPSDWIAQVEDSGKLNILDSQLYHRSNKSFLK